MRIKSRIKFLVLSLPAIAALSGAYANAATNLVKNGNFESVSNGGNKQLSSSITNDTHRTTLIDWTSSNGNDGGYNFVLSSNIANTWDSAIWLKSQNNGWATSANGGNIFASDSQYWPGVLSQTITGLTAGSKYTLSFDYALAQQVGFDGANSNNYWQIGFGNSTQNSSALSIASGGFSGWNTASMTFTASGASQVLSFLAQGSPGAPPFLLLDSVSMAAAVPEPSTWGMLAAGLGLIGFAARRRMVKQA